jgi:hypothetical protein
MSAVQSGRKLVGIYAIFYGFTEIFGAFDLHALRDRIDRLPAGRPAQ